MQINKIWMDGELIKAEDAKIHILSHVIHYGSGIFEGIRLYDLNNGKSGIFRLPDHTKRLIESASIYKMRVPYSQKEIDEAIILTLKENNLNSAYIRPLVYRGYKELGLNPSNCPVNVMIAAWEWGTYLGKEGLEKGISACISSWNRPAANTLPALSKASGNYLSSQLIKMEALDNGFEEGIALDVHGYISEGAGENVFVIKDGVIYTTPYSESILPGITRHSIMTLAEKHGIKVIERKMPREFLYLADEIFLVGTAAEVTPVTMLDNRPVGVNLGANVRSHMGADIEGELANPSEPTERSKTSFPLKQRGKRGAITTLLQKDFFDLVEGRAKDEFGWLTVI